jgi:hypothetical protein
MDVFPFALIPAQDIDRPVRGTVVAYQKLDLHSTLP